MFGRVPIRSSVSPSAPLNNRLILDPPLSSTINALLASTVHTILSCKLAFLTACKRINGKVMFSVGSVCQSFYLQGRCPCIGPSPSPCTGPQPQPPGMFKLVHYEARTSGKWAAGTRLKYLLVFEKFWRT